MKFAIVGAGALGGTFGALLTMAGSDVWLLEIDKNRVGLIKREGLWIIREGDAKEQNVKVKITSNPEEIGKVDLIQICVKSYHTESAVKGALLMANENTYFLSVQNGIGNLEIISQYAGKERVIGGVTAHSAMMIGPNRIKYVGGYGNLVIGMYSGLMDPFLFRIGTAFDKAGIKTEIVNDIMPFIWRKLLANAAVNAIAAIVDMTGSELYSNPYTMELIRQIAIETANVAKAKNIWFSELEKPVEYVEKALLGVKDNKVSMLQDFLAGRRTEIDFINYAVVKEAEKLAIDVPFNKIVTYIIKAIERKRFGIDFDEEKQRKTA